MLISTRFLWQKFCPNDANISVRWFPVGRCSYVLSTIYLLMSCVYPKNYMTFYTQHGDAASGLHWDRRSRNVRPLLDSEWKSHTGGWFHFLNIPNMQLGHNFTKTDNKTVCNCAWLCVLLILVIHHRGTVQINVACICKRDRHWSWKHLGMC